MLGKKSPELRREGELDAVHVTAAHRDALCMPQVAVPWAVRTSLQLDEVIDECRHHTR